MTAPLHGLAGRFDARMSVSCAAAPGPIPRRRASQPEGRSNRKRRIQIVLTAEEREEVRPATGKNAAAPRLQLQQLEERIAPVRAC